MLQRAERLSIPQGRSLYVAAIEDLIALKVQALCNDPERAVGDWADIRLLLRAAADQNISLDWELLLEYLEIFQLSTEFDRIRSWYVKTE